MFKTTALALLAVITTATTIVPSHAINLPGRGNKPVVSSNDDDCAYQLNYMPHVTRAHIEAIAGRDVYLIPVCEDGLIGRNDDYGWLFTSGNVGTLRQPIARNTTLMNALSAEGYDQQDVISLRFGGEDDVVLYVHQRTLR
jgi:hypothetical protein